MPSLDEYAARIRKAQPELTDKEVRRSAQYMLDDELEQGPRNYCKQNPDSDYCSAMGYGKENGKKAGGKVNRSNMEKQTKYRKGGMCKSKKGYAKGGMARGCGAAVRGTRKAKIR
jgi:hypothetical protein